MCFVCPLFTNEYNIYHLLKSAFVLDRCLDKIMIQFMTLNSNFHMLKWICISIAGEINLQLFIILQMHEL